jgi:uncharacterized protein with ATP-grasp and redox domains
MKLNLDCIPCFQRQALQAARFVTDDEKLQEEILREVITELVDMDWSKSPPEISHIVHRIVKERTGEDDPYKTVKKQYNDIALELYSRYKKFVEDSSTPLLSSIRLAIAGNVIDFGASSGFNLNDTIKTVLTKDFRIFDYEKLEKSLQRTGELTYLADNTGEIVFDRILLETIIDRYDVKKINFAVKGAPIINDATLEDAVYTGITDLENLDIIKIDVGMNSPGLKRTGAEFLDICANSGTVISKGQGNYEALSEYKTIFFLLMAKCPVIANDLGANIGDIILKG